MNTKSDQGDPPNSKRVPLSKELQDHIGGKLRAAYGQLVQEPVPERFSDLLKQLSEAESSHGKAKSASDEEPQT